MATRMQQRRGTAAQWTSADPILAAGEIGFESDTGQFKIGDGTNHWDDLSYFKNLEDLGGTLDDYIPLTQRNTANGVATLDASGYIPVTQLGNLIGDAPSILNTLGEIADVLNDSSSTVNLRISAASAADRIVTDGDITAAINQEATDRDQAISTAVGTHSSDTTSVHGIADTTALATNTSVNTAVSDHNLDTTNVHGIVDTSVLVTTTQLNLKQDIVTDVSSTEIGYLNGVTSAIQTQIDGKAATSHSHAISDVTGLQTAIDAKASLAGATFTGNVEVDGNLVVDGDFTVNGTNFSASATTITIEDNLVQLAHQNAANTVDLGLVVGYNDGAAKHSGIVRDVSADTWKLFKGVTTEPTTTVDFTQGSLDNLSVNNITAAGVVFTDGTQALEGVPSRTVIIQRTASNTLSGVERDDLIEMASASAMTLTIPTDSTFNFPIGTSIDVLQTSTGQVTIAGAGGVTVNATPGLKLRTQWSSATLFKRAANTWVVFGDLSA
jgi:hypothetical protein